VIRRSATRERLSWPGMEEERYPGTEGSLWQRHLPDLRVTMELFGMHIRRVERRWTYPPHSHPQYELNYVTDGEQIMTVDGTAYRQRAGDLVFVGPMQVHSARSGDSDGFTYLCIHFIIDDMLLLPILNQHREVLFERESALVKALKPHLDTLTVLAYQPFHGQIGFRLRLQSTLLALLARMAEELYRTPVRADGLSEAKRALAQQIEEQLLVAANRNAEGGVAMVARASISAIAARLGLSAGHCARVFREVYGMAPRTYLSRLKVDQAKYLLLQPHLTVEQVARLLWYESAAHFSRQFKRWTGVSPRAFRNAYLKGGDIARAE
jgi:AraC family transcriptional activator of pobA